MWAAGNTKGTGEVFGAGRTCPGRCSPQPVCWDRRWGARQWTCGRWFWCGWSRTAHWHRRRGYIGLGKSSSRWKMNRLYIWLVYTLYITGTSVTDGSRGKWKIPPTGRQPGKTVSLKTPAVSTSYSVELSPHTERTTQANSEITLMTHSRSLTPVKLKC